MPHADAGSWAMGLQELLNTVPRAAPPAYWRWVLCCMAETSERGHTGVLRQTELRALLRRANASSGLSTHEIHEALRSVGVSEQPAALLKSTYPSSSRPSGTEGGEAQQQPQNSSRSRLGDLRRTFSFTRRKDTLLDAPRLTGMLLRLCTSSPTISALFDNYAAHGEMDLERWLSFVRNEQLARGHVDASLQLESDDKQLALAATSFKTALRRGNVTSERLSRLQFSLQILGPQNDAVALAQDTSETDGCQIAPLSHYWTACSHNSYVVGDQLTGRSTADAYRRQLLQGCRHLEIDCWDGRRGRPIVTHGNTLCTVEDFDRVAFAIAETAFVNSPRPVMLSMEMHCSNAQQNNLSKMLVEHVGDGLLTYSELVTMGGAASLSPADLQNRVLLKGKVKERRQQLLSQSGSCASLRRSSSKRMMKTLFVTSKGLSRATRTSIESIEPMSPGTPRLQHAASVPSVPKTSSPIHACSQRSTCDRDTDRDTGDFTRNTAASGSGLSHNIVENAQGVEFMAQQRVELEKRGRRSASSANDELYTSILTLRSLPLSEFFKHGAPHWPLTISSINEDRLLKELKLPEAERRQIEGLMVRGSSWVDGEAGLTEEQMSSRALVRLAADPPPEVGIIQRRTLSWLLRPYPLGLRFSGKNMSPLVGWMAGAQYIALNMSNTDLAVQLHFALFRGSNGFVLKPLAMRENLAAPNEAQVRDSFVLGSGQRQAGQLTDYFWPSPCDILHRTNIRVVSLHNLPKRGEERPRYDGSRSAAHKYHPELSGMSVPPNDRAPSSPSITLSLHQIGGSCAISTELPLPQRVDTKSSVSPASNGMNAHFDQMFYCVAAEPHATFLRVSVADGAQEVAYETAVLGRLRSGYRVIQMRGTLGTRIECCFVLIQVKYGSEDNLHQTPRELRVRRRLIK